MSIKGFMEKGLKISLSVKGPYRPQSLQRDDEMGENRTPSCM